MHESLLTAADLAEIAKKVALPEQTHQLSQRSEIPLGFLGDHLTLTLQPSGQCFFVKTHPVRPIMGEDFVGETGMFQREVDVYQTLFHRFAQVLKKEVSWCPPCIFSKEKVLVLADLSKKGYGMLPERSSEIDWQHLIAAVDAISALHAASIIFEESSGTTIATAFPHIVKELMYTDDQTTPSYKWIVAGIDKLLAGIEFLRGYTSEEKCKITQLLPKILMEIYPRNAPSTRQLLRGFLTFLQFLMRLNNVDRFRNVFVHGDLWLNNLMFKSKPDGQSLDCKLVDFQFSRLQPPAYDLMNLLYLTTTKKLRDHHEKEVCDYYYNKLKGHLTERSLNVEEIIRAQAWEESCQFHKRIALIQALLSLDYVLPADNHEQFTENVERSLRDRMKENLEHPPYKNRVLDIFYELIENTMGIVRKTEA